MTHWNSFKNLCTTCYLNMMYDDYYIALFTIRRNGMYLADVSSRLQDNYDIVLSSVQQNGMSLRYASSRLQDNYDIVLSAVQQNGMSLRYASMDLNNNNDIVLTAIQQDARALQYALQDIIKYKKEIFKTYSTESILEMLILEKQIKPIHKIPYYDCFVTCK